jgi:peptidoglycan/xylan/chitin deacetylase (PgdA/CDA1 family)
MLYFFVLLGFLLGKQQVHGQVKNFTYMQGAIVRGDSTKKEIAFVFTADETGEGLPAIIQTLKQENVKGNFFFTGRFYRNKTFKKDVEKLKHDDHYFGPHSDNHLLYCDWAERDSLLVTKDSFDYDIERALQTMTANGLTVHHPQLFIPPYEWWNDSIASWSDAKGLVLTNFTPGIRTNADYTWPEMGNAYKSSEWLMNWLKETMTSDPKKFQGAIILIHAGTDKRRKDKLYNRLHEIIHLFKQNGFEIKRIDELLKGI